MHLSHKDQWPLPGIDRYAFRPWKHSEPYSAKLQQLLIMISLTLSIRQ